MSFEEFERESKRQFRRFAIGIGVFMALFLVAAMWWGSGQAEECKANGGVYSWRHDLCIPKGATP